MKHVLKGTYGIRSEHVDGLMLDNFETNNLAAVRNDEQSTPLCATDPFIKPVSVLSSNDVDLNDLDASFASIGWVNDLTVSRFTVEHWDLNEVQNIVYEEGPWLMAQDGDFIYKCRMNMTDCTVNVPERRRKWTPVVDIPENL